MPSDGCYEEIFHFLTVGAGACRPSSRNHAEARAEFINAREEIEQIVRNQPDYAAALCALGVVDAALGNKADATREGKRAVELMPVSKSAIEGAMLTHILL